MEEGLLGLLSSIGNFFIGTVGTITLQEVFTKIKEQFGDTIAEKIEKAYRNTDKMYNMSEEEINIQVSTLDKLFQEKLLYGVNLLEDKDLTPNHKLKYKFFLIEVFKDPVLAAQILNLKIDKLIANTNNILKSVDPKKITLNRFSTSHFISSINNEKTIEYYIPRKIYCTNCDRYVENFEQFIVWNSKQEVKQISLRALIIADGGIGKTTLIKKWAVNMAALQRLYPVFVSLRDCKPQDVLQDYIERHHPDLRTIDITEYKNLCFFLDGFDEIGDTDSGIKQINDFQKSHPEAHICLTCRKNSYFDYFPDFQVYNLTDITLQDIETYIVAAYPQYQINIKHFIEEVDNNNFSNLLINPFYLNILIDSYLINKHSLNISKKELIDNLLISRSKKDIENRPKLNRPDLKRFINKLGRKIAFIMALMEQRSIEENLFILLCENEFELAIQALPIKKGNSYKDVQYWEFEHNIFLEHLVASVLKDRTFEQIIEYAVDKQQIKPQWKDILIYLLGILDKNKDREDKLFSQVLDWVIEKQPEILIRVEKSQLSTELRLKIFHEVLRWYEKRTIWLNENKISLAEFASLGETKENIYSLFKSIADENVHWRNRANMASIFKHFSFNALSLKEKDQLAKDYLEIIKRTPDDDERVLYHLINNYPFENKDCLDKLIDLYSYSNSSNIRSAIRRIIVRNQLQDERVDVFLNELKRRNGESVADVISLNPSLTTGLHNLQKVESYLKLFNFFLDNSMVFYNFSSYYKKECAEIFSNCSKIYNSEIIEAIIGILNECLFISNYDVILSFFREEHIRKEGINNIISHIKKETGKTLFSYTLTLTTLLKTEDLSEVFNQIHLQEFYINIYRISGISNKEIADRVKFHLIERFNYSEDELSNRENATLVIDQTQVEWESYFDEEKFKKEIFALFEYVEKDEIDIPNLWLEVTLNIRYYNPSVIQFLQDIKKDKIISKEQLSEWFKNNPNKLYNYLHTKIYQKLERNIEDKYPLTEKKIEYIHKWYCENLLTTDYGIEIIDREKESFRLNNYRSQQIIFYTERFHFECPDEILCKMISIPLLEKNTLINRITDRDLLKDTLIENLINYSDFLSHQSVMHSKYSIDNKFIETYPFIISILKDREFNEEEKDKIIIYWCNHNLLETEIINIQSFLTQKNLFTLSSILIDKGNILAARNFLYEILKSPKDDDIRRNAINLLIKTRDPEGLKQSLQLSKEQKLITLNNEFYRSSSAIEISENLLYYDDIAVLPLLMEYLEFTFDKELSKEELTSRMIEKNLTSLALLSKNNYEVVIKTLQQFLDNNKGKIEDIENINFLIEDIKRQYFNKNMKIYSFDEAYDICNSLIF